MKQTSQLFLQFRKLPQQAVCDRRNSLPDKLVFLPLPCSSAELPLRVALWKEHLCDLYCTQPRAGWIPGHTDSAFGGLGFSVLGLLVSTTLVHSCGVPVTCSKRRREGGLLA